MREIVTVFLMMLPAGVIGFVCGMVFMRFCYLDELRRARIEKGRAMRYVEARARNERALGYAVGYREGQRG